MPGLFNTVIVKKPKRNAFGLSHEVLQSQSYGKLAPCDVIETLPGDDFRINSECHVKLSPLRAPVMGRIDVTLMTFYVPNYLIYTDWDKFISSGELGLYLDGTEADPVAPWFDYNEAKNAGLLTKGSLADYMGLPPMASTADDVLDCPPINALPFLAYHKIYSDWFRDELLDVTEFEPVQGGKITGDALTALLTLHDRAWRKDYFTSARPDTQLGAAVSVPLTGDVQANGPLRITSNQLMMYTNNAVIPNINNSPEVVDDGYFGENKQVGSLGIKDSSSNIGEVAYYEGLTLGEAGMLINDLRYCLKLQEWKEKDMRGGNRNVEYLLHHWGVQSEDQRLLRSRYIGGRNIPVVVGDVTQTSPQFTDSATEVTTVIGTLAGKGTASGSVRFSRCYCNQYGWILTLSSIMPHALYQQGIPRMYGHRWSRFQYAWPEFSNIGEQEVYNWEIYLDKGHASESNEASNKFTFGYQSRFAEYKFMPNRVAGDFRDSLAYWHTGRIFASRPHLNKSFVYMDSTSRTSQNRIFALTDDSNELFYCHYFHHVSALRALTKYGIPSI